jgi:predicted PurR-regulated permease PerM
MAWAVTGDPWAPVSVIILLAVVQYLEANLIFPKVVGGRLGLNTLASIVLVLIGAMAWGASGMVLFLPFASLVLMIAEGFPAGKALILFLGTPSSPHRAT